MKKKLAILVACVMLLSLAIPLGATANQQGDLTITINPPQTLDGLTFELHKVFDLTTHADGYTYVIAPGFATFPVPVPYTSLREYVDYIGTLDPTAQEPLLRDLGKDLATFIGNTAPARTVIGAGQSVTTENLDAGYYLIITKVAATNAIDTVRFALISIEEGNAPYVINIGRKVDAPNIDKEIENGDDEKWINAKVGDKLDFKVSATVPGNIDDYDDVTGYYIIRDTMVNLTYVADSLKVTLNGNAFTDYTAVYNPTTKVLEITFDVEALKGNAGALIEAKYSAALDSTAFINDEGDGNTNTVQVVYRVDGDTDEHITIVPEEPPTPKVFTFGFEIDKFAEEASGKKALQGAEFELSYGGAVLWFTVDAGRYILTETPVGTPPAGVTSTLVSNANGRIFVRGLNVGTYSLKEIKAPDGYALLDSPIEIVITHTTGDGIPVITQNGLQITGPAVIGVLNSLGSIFPETGGIGRTIFFITGGLIMFGATTMIIIRKKKAGARTR